jgi:hypothetical protein
MRIKQLTKGMPIVSFLYDVPENTGNEKMGRCGMVYLHVNKIDPLGSLYWEILVCPSADFILYNVVIKTLPRTKHGEDSP